MQTVNIHEAKTHLSRLAEQAGAGEEIIIAKAGRPVARLMPLAPLPTQRKLGLLEGKYAVPEDIDTPFAADIERLFYGDGPGENAGSAGGG